MNDIDDPTVDEPLAEALRTMYTGQAQAAGFEPLVIQAGKVAARAQAHRRRTGRLLLAAAVVTVLAGSGALLAQPLFAPQPIPASPEPANPTQPADPTQSAAPDPTRTPFTGGGAWSWVATTPVPLGADDSYETVTVDGVDYVVTKPHARDGGCLPVQLLRYLPESGTWRSETSSPAAPSGLCPFEVIGWDGDLYVTLYDGGPITEIQGWHLGETNPLLVYRPAEGSWTPADRFPTRPEAFAQEFCVRLPSALFCVERTTGEAYTGRYQFFDVAARAWRTGRSAGLASIPASPIGDVPRPVTVDGRTLLLFTSSPVSAEPSGEIRLFLLDPDSGELVMQTSRELPHAQLEAIRFPQVLAPGLLYGGPESVHDELARAVLVDLRTGEWRDVEVPGPAPWPAATNDTLNHLNSAAWAKRVHGAELAAYAVVRDYLYDPLQDRWLVLPVVTVPPPDLDPPEGDEVTSYLWYGSGPLQCDYRGVEPCYELRTDPLARLAQDLSYEQVMARPTAVR